MASVVYTLATLSPASCRYLISRFRKPNAWTTNLLNDGVIRSGGVVFYAVDQLQRSLCFSRNTIVRFLICKNAAKGFPDQLVRKVIKVIRVNEHSQFLRFVNFQTQLSKTMEFNLFQHTPLRGDNNGRLAGAVVLKDEEGFSDLTWDLRRPDDGPCPNLSILSSGCRPAD